MLDRRYTTIRLVNTQTQDFITVPMPENVDTDAVGNATFSLLDPLGDVRTQLQPFLTGRPTQYANRANEHVIVADNPKLILCTWGEAEPYEAGVVRARALVGCAVIPTARFARREEAFSLVMYRASRALVRGSGHVIEQVGG